MRKIKHATLGIFTAVLIFFIVFVNANAAAGGNSGAIWTTRGDCGEETQDANHYEIGEHIFINGHQFDPGDYEWEIKGLPGNASCDPGAVVASGTFTITEADEGKFCFDAYTVAEDDCGEYQVKFGNKGDNYRVHGRETEESLEIDVRIVKYVNDEDANTPTGPQVYIGSTVTWKYVITNPGEASLGSISVVDDQPGVTPIYQSGDLNNNDSLDTNETWIYTATGIAVQGQYKNVGTVTGSYKDQTVSDEDPAHYFGFAQPAPDIDIEKYINDEDADVPDGPNVGVGSTVTFKYIVTNTGNVTLNSISVTDDQPGVTPVYESGDANDNDLLEVNETWIYIATASAIQGPYKNIGTVTGSYEEEEVEDDDPAHYLGVAENVPGIKIVKYVNEEDANEPTGPVVTVGSTVTFTYVVTNTGNVPLADVSVDDDKPGVNPVYQSGDANEDGYLDTNETWIYSATAAAVEGQYKNIGTVTGTYEDQTVNDDDPAHYFGEYETGCVDGTIYSNGQPQANVLVRLETPGRKSAKQRTDSNGYYRFDNVIRGFEYTLSVNGQPELTRTVVVDDQLACQTQDLFGGGCKPVFALYQTWFGGVDNDSTLRYWAAANKGGVTDTSVVGFYDSYDEKIMEYHILLAWASDIDALVVDWYGMDSFEDGPTHKLLNTVERLYKQYHHLGFNFNIIVSYNEEAAGDLAANLKFLADSILTHPGYYGTFEKKPKPVFVHAHHSEFAERFLALAKIYLPSDVQILLNFEESNLALAPQVTGFYPHLTDAEDIHDPLGREWGEKYLTDFYNSDTKNLPLQVGGTWPGLDDRQWVQGRGLYVDRQDTLVYEKTWDKAFENQPDWMLIQSWNSFNQTTQIEVSEQEGYKFVKMSRNKAVLWKSGCAREVDDLGLTVPQAVLQARTRNIDSLYVDQALFEFFQRNYNQALAILNIAGPVLDQSQPKNDRDDQLVFVEGSDTNKKQNWDNAVDGEVSGWKATTTAKWNGGAGNTYAIFEFADQGKYLFNSVYLQTDNGTDDDPYSSRQATDVEILVSTTGTNPLDFQSVMRFQPRDGAMRIYKLNRYVTAAYIKIVLHGPDYGQGGWVQMVEFGVASDGKYAAKPVTEAALVAAIPMTFSLEQNYPNPFNPGTTIRYDLPEQARVVLKIFDLTGREVATLVDEVQEGGQHTTTWNASSLASGTYLYQLRAGAHTAVKRMTLVK